MIADLSVFPTTAIKLGIGGAAPMKETLPLISVGVDRISMENSFEKAIDLAAKNG